MGKFIETRKRLFHPTPSSPGTTMETFYPMKDDGGEPVSVPVNEDSEVELSDYHIHRIDEIYNAALDFCCVITQNENLPWSMYSLGEIVEHACAMILTDPMLGVDEIFFPSIVTDEDGNKHIEESYQASDFQRSEF